MSRFVLLAAAIALLGLNGYLYGALFSRATIRVVPLSVEKGGATLVLLPGGHALLIDAGHDASIVRALGGALPPWQRHLDALFILSGSKGEGGGVPFVQERYRVSTLQKIPPGAGLLLHYKGVTLPLASTTAAGTYALK